MVKQFVCSWKTREKKYTANIVSFFFHLQPNRERWKIFWAKPNLYRANSQIYYNIQCKHGMEKNAGLTTNYVQRNICSQYTHYHLGVSCYATRSFSSILYRLYCVHFTCIHAILRTMNLAMRTHTHKHKNTHLTK